MSRLFRRVYRVTIGDVQTDALACHFSVTRTLWPWPGSCELTVLNLTRDQRAALAHQAGRRATLRRVPVRVEAGYADTGPSLLFQGDCLRLDITRDGADWGVKVTAGDGAHGIRTARAARSFAPGTRAADVVRYLAGLLGVGEGNVAAAFADVPLAFPAGTVVHGPAWQHLVRLCRSAGVEVSVQNQILQVIPRGQALQRASVLLTADTGLLGVPQRGKNLRLMSCAALIQPDLVPGRMVRVESQALTGNYRIDRATWTGDTHGADWKVDLEGRALATAAP